jgi:hypothetical protein
VLFEAGQLEQVIAWLNQTPQEVDYLTLKKALRKRTMSLPNNKWLEEKHSLHRSKY